MELGLVHSVKEPALPVRRVSCRRYRDGSVGADGGTKLVDETVAEIESVVGMANRR